MEVRHCHECRKLIQYPGFGVPMCEECRKKDEEEFQKVKTFLRDHPGVGEKDVIDVTQVDPKKLIQWLREERLVVTDASNFSLTCETCGAKITSGKFCAECKRKLALEFGSARQSDAPSPDRPAMNDKRNRMRFLNSR